MNRLFWGFLLVFLDVSIHFDAIRVELLPDFAGYLLLLLGLQKLEGESRHFSNAKPWALLLVIYTAVLYAMGLFAREPSAQLLVWGMEALACVADLLISYGILLGTQEVEKRLGVDLQTQRLKTTWIYLAVLQGISRLCGWIPFVGAGCEVANLVMGICFLAAFYRTKGAYGAATGDRS